MKATILSVLLATALAVSATAQDFQITNGMAFADVVTAWGQPDSINQMYTRSTMKVVAWGEPASVDLIPSPYGYAERWYMSNGWLVVFANAE